MRSSWLLVALVVALPVATPRRRRRVVGPCGGQHATHGDSMLRSEGEPLFHLVVDDAGRALRLCNRLETAPLVERAIVCQMAVGRQP